jgi:ethanolamine utilization protein EutA
VAEFVYEREAAEFGDLGRLLARELRPRLGRLGAPLLPPSAGIRATVIGASQYTVQLSGNTIYLSSPEAVPLRSLPVVVPRLDLAHGPIDAGAVRAAIQQALERLDLQPPERALALAIDWAGSASFGRLDAFCRGVVAALDGLVQRRLPLVLVTGSDVGGLIGLHLKEVTGVPGPVISIDGVELRELDFIDIGELVPASGAVPVIVKSLIFP